MRDRAIRILASNQFLAMMFCLFTAWLAYDLWHGRTFWGLAHAGIVGMYGATWLLRRDRGGTR